MHPSRRAARLGVGFTLVGVAVALALLGLASAIALASLSRSRVSAALHDSRQIVVAAISLARSSAKQSGRPVSLWIDSAGERLWVEAHASTDDTRRVDTLGYFTLVEVRVDLESNRRVMCFDGRGVGTTSDMCPLAGGVIVLSAKEHADTVIVSPLGRVLP